MGRIEISQKRIADLKLKEAIKWVKVAPQRNCMSCKHMERQGLWSQFFYCKLYKFRTLANAICYDYDRRKK